MNEKLSLTLVRGYCSDPTAKRKQSGCTQKCCVISRYGGNTEGRKQQKHSPYSWETAFELLLFDHFIESYCKSILKSSQPSPAPFTRKKSFCWI
ncbi:hypothetical protein CEXT_435281 [Caerostris extrusa]|uniref:Uncharacterized protein n=1 Tax=Caerostris extrusa TaxID=172846 RepID=A0AAV4SJ20_CAEEX|nr:hypothetical protein CEXT_435281 [Caerostris extrusa]